MRESNRAQEPNAAGAVDRVDFYFDAMCPWAYRASCWIREVRRQTDLSISWRFFSLEEINRQDGKRHPWERPWSYGWSQLRVAALLRRQGHDLVDHWYEAAGRAFFEDGLPTFTRTGAEDVVASLGLPRAVVGDALDDPSTADEVNADHEHLVGSFGGHGVPTLVFDDRDAFFGPVVLTVPTGPAAVRLWDLVRGWREFPDLYELRRPKSEGDLAAIGESFSTYLQARQWPTIEHPAP
jgi:2-hydroxychromene-2-carboxylate isomerase